VTDASLPSFDELLRPLSMDDWRRHHLDRHAVLLRAPERRWGVLSALDGVGLASTAPTGHVDLIRGGVAQAIEPGATPDDHRSVRVKRLQAFDETVRRFAVGVAAALQEEVNVNLYLSPSGESPGLAPHTDPYDVFVIQLAGRKRWELLGDPEGRLAAEPVTTRGGLTLGTEGELDVRAGDVLYLPRGLAHRANNPGPEPSVHLALSLLVKTMRSCIDWLASELERRLDADRPLPLGASPEERERALDELRAAAEAILTDEARAEAFTAHRDIVEYEGLMLSPAEKAARPRR
jgi:ribosomal protein L16 Arg81 hydroxylase